MMVDSLFIMKHEFMLIAILVMLLLMKIFGSEEGKNNLRIIQGIWFLNFLFGLFMNKTGSAFGNMYVTNELFIFEKNVLNGGMMLIFLIADSWIKKNEHLTEFFLLITSCLLGMFLMISSGHMLMFYLAMELSAIPLAALCNWDLKNRKSSEAAMKMIFSSAFASGIMLMGISLLYGATGTFSFQLLAGNPVSSVLYIPGFVFFFAGLAFKLSVVPFHFWTADVYEGSPVTVTAFLSVISKAAMVFVIVTVLYQVFRVFVPGWYLLICVLSVTSMLVGNIFAIRQTNLQRFMAFSSIAQIGFILIGISGSSVEGMASSVYFVLIYMLSNLAVFAVIADLKAKGKETISDVRGLSRSNPLLAWTLALGLFSLAGIPPTAGFFGKLFLLKAGASTGNYSLIIIAALNMIVSLYYYLRIVKATFIDPAPDTLTSVPSGSSSKMVIVICIVGILAAGFFGVVYDFIYSLSTGI